MPIECGTSLDTDIVNDACDIPVKGLVKNGKTVFIAKEKIDKTASTEADGVITVLTLLKEESGNDVFHAQSLANGASEFAYSADSFSGYTHSYTGRINFPLGTSPAVLKQLEHDYVLVLDTNQDNEAKYKVLGWKSGLCLKESTWNTNEEFASVIFTMGTPEGSLEDMQFKTYFNESAEASKIEFEAKFVNPTV